MNFTKGTQYIYTASDQQLLSKEQINLEYTIIMSIMISVKMTGQPKTKQIFFFLEF